MRECPSAQLICRSYVGIDDVEGQVSPLNSPSHPGRQSDPSWVAFEHILEKDLKQESACKLVGCYVADGFKRKPLSEHVSASTCRTPVCPTCVARKPEI